MDSGRIKTAVNFLKDGQSFKVGDLRLGMNAKNDMYITGWSHYLNLENLTKHRALEELQQIKNLFKRMLDTSQELREFVQNKSVKYNLAFDYGMGSIDICSEINGDITWSVILQ